MRSHCECMFHVEHVLTVTTSPRISRFITLHLTDVYEGFSEFHELEIPVDFRTGSVEDALEFIHPFFLVWDSGNAPRGVPAPPGEEGWVIVKDELREVPVGLTDDLV